MKKKEKVDSLPNREETPSKAPFDKTHKLENIDLLTAVVPNGQSEYIVDLLNENQAAVCFVSHGKGTAPSSFYEVMGWGENKKQIIFSLIVRSSWAKIKSSLLTRFQTSDWSRGVAFTLPLDSICGVSAYNMLVNNRGDNKKEESTMEEVNKKSDYEMVMVIVNDGFTDLVMEAAKEAGAKGGTILTARGTGNKDIEKFFGVVITPEKQIVIILVPKTIKDKVISNIYKQAGLNTKGQGICFALSCHDVCGIVENEEEAKPQLAD
ncbi:MAG: P-II family nitrogen regulator [Bacilli bacterium]|jgi:nitrogen regulatory protein PII|nr:P-II family nitrogen regulator [Bacilli bacterium]